LADSQPRAAPWSPISLVGQLKKTPVTDQRQPLRPPPKGSQLLQTFDPAMGSRREVEFQSELKGVGSPKRLTKDQRAGMMEAKIPR